MEKFMGKFSGYHKQTIGDVVTEETFIVYADGSMDVETKIDGREIKKQNKVTKATARPTLFSKE